MNPSCLILTAGALVIAQPVFGAEAINANDASGSQPKVEETQPGKEVRSSFDADQGKYHFTIDATAAPDLMPWAEEKLKPVVREWYPKIVALLPSDGFQARTNVTLRFRNDMEGTPASAGGGGINMNSGWFRKELAREARGSVVHEMVHVIQSYGSARRNNPNATRTPGWLVEGLADYIRWFLYEPETRGAEITVRNLARARYDASYRITGNFLNWVIQTYDRELLRKLNAAAREGKYTPQLWKGWTGKPVEELGAEWLKQNQARLQSSSGVAAAAEGPGAAMPPEPDGMKSLFNGSDLAGWDGDPRLWSVKNGVIRGETTQESPAKGNTFLILKDQRFADFDLRFSFRCTADNNSGVQYRSRHITEGNVSNGWVVRGYQHEIRNENVLPNVSGFIYEEGGKRGRICLVGEKAVWENGAKSVTGTLVDQGRFTELFKLNEWNDAVILARGNRIRHFLNGVLIVDFTDNDPQLALKEGIVALQLHAGKPMWAEFKNLRIKELSPAR